VAAESFPQDIAKIIDDGGYTKDEIFMVMKWGHSGRCHQEPSLQKRRKPCQASNQLKIG
jgi:hypothetical protein